MSAGEDVRALALHAIAGAACGAAIVSFLGRRSKDSGAAPAAPAGPPPRDLPWGVDFRGRRALVTGAASGIGRAIAVRLAQCGATIVALDRDAAQLETLSKELPGLVTTAVCDLADLDSIRKVLAEVGTVDMLANVAGIAVFQQFFDATPEMWDLTMDINARATWFLTQQVAKGMVAKGGGAIVNVSSQSSTVVVSDRHLAYSTSKAAVDHITRSAAISVARQNVRVNAVNPTVVRTELAIKAHGEAGLAKMAEKVPLGKVCEPEHVADAVVFLLSDRAKMITGITMPVDGGFLAAR